MIDLGLDMTERFPPIQDLSSSQTQALTKIVFGPESEPRPADIGFVFGGSHPGLWQTAIWAFRQKLVLEFVVTGRGLGRKSRHTAWTFGERPEAIVIADQMIRSGVPSTVITIEDQSNNTLENVLFAIQRVDLTRFASILAISKSYSTGRQVRTLRKNLPARVEIFSLSFPAEIEGVGPIDRYNWMKHPLSIRFVLGEYARNILFGEKGDIVAVDPVPGVRVHRTG